jgi:hypothetical protein
VLQTLTYTHAGQLFIHFTENIFTYVSYYIGTFGMIHAVLHLSETECLVEAMKCLILYVVSHAFRANEFANRL